MLKPEKYIALNAMLIFFLAFMCLISSGAMAEDASGPLELTLDDAILMALRNNTSLKIELYKPETSALRIEQEKAAFDPLLSSSASTSGSNAQDTDTENTSVDVKVSKSLTSGGVIGLDVAGSDSSGGTSGGGSSAGITISLSHPLFKGAGDNVTLAGLHKAELDSDATIFELQGYVESFIEQVESAYLDYALAGRQLKIYEESMNLAEKQLEETQALVDVGKIAGVEIVASQAEVASRKEALINARSTLTKSRLTLLRLLNPPGIDYWNQDITVKDELRIPEYDAGEVEMHMSTALEKRADLNAARILIEQNAIDVVTTRNGLLPDLELFAGLGMSGYADSFGNSFSNISGNNNDFRVGVNYNYTFGQKDLQVRHKQAVISEEQSKEALDNMTQLAREDVGSAWIEVNRAAEQITATAATRVLQEEKLRAETEKYRVGKSTSLLVAQAQRDLTSAQINEVGAIVNYRKAIIDLYRNEGTLLDVYGISLSDLIEES